MRKHWRWYHRWAFRALERGLSGVLAGSVWDLIATEEQRSHGAHNPDPDGAFLLAHQKLALVYICVDRIASFAAQIMLQAYEIPRGETEDDAHLLPYDHEANQLMRYVNPMQTRFDLTYGMVGYLLLRGDVYLLLDDYRGAFNYSGPPKEMHLLRPDRVTLVPGEGKEGPILGYLYKFRGTTYKFAANEIIHLKTFNPYDDWYGQSCIQAGQQTLISDYVSEGHNLNIVKGGGIPPGYMQITGSSTPEQRTELRKEYESAMRPPDGPARMPILRSDVDFKKTGLTPNDLQILESRRFNREMILGLFGMVPVMAALTDKVAYRTADIQTKIFARFTAVQPRLQLIQEQLTQYLAPQFGERVIYRYATEKHPAFQEDQVELMRMGADAVKHRIWTPNMVNKRLFGIDEPVPGGDTFMVPQNSVPIEQLAGEPMTPEKAAGAVKQRAKIVYTKEQAQRMERYIRRFESTERKVLPILIEMFRKQEEHAVKLLEEGGRSPDEIWTTERGIDDVIDPTQLRQTTKDALDKVLYEGCISGIAHGSEPLPIAVDFTIDTPAVVSFLETESLSATSDIVGTTKTALQKALAEGADKGETMKEIEARIRSKFKEFKAGRVRTIARTEIERAVQDTQNELWKAAEVVEKKEWVSALIETTRDDHASEHGHSVLMGEMFPVTHLEYPGDSRGSADQTVNCKCDMFPIIATEKMLDILMAEIEDFLEPVPAGAGGKGSRLCETSELLKAL